MTICWAPDWARYAEGGTGGIGGRPAGGGPGGLPGARRPGRGPGDFSEFFRGCSSAEGGARGGGFEGVDFEEGGRRSAGAGLVPAGVRDLETEVEITLEEAHAGARRTVEFQQLEPCGTCRGSGRQGKGPCGTCGGTGRRAARLPDRGEDPGRGPRRVSGARRRRGRDGRGRRDARRPLPQGPHTQPHPVFERREDDLHVELPLAVWEAALGAEVEVPTLRGKVAMKIPPETSSGRTFRLPGYGLPHVKGGGRGDQLVRVRIVVPRELSARGARALRGACADCAPPRLANRPERIGARWTIRPAGGGVAGRYAGLGDDRTPRAVPGGRPRGRLAAGVVMQATG